MQLLVICRDERCCDFCPEDALVELHENPPRARTGYLAFCASCLTIDLLERRTTMRLASQADSGSRTLTPAV